MTPLTPERLAELDALYAADQKEPFGYAVFTRDLRNSYPALSAALRAAWARLAEAEELLRWLRAGEECGGGVVSRLCHRVYLGDVPCPCRERSK